MVDRVVFHVGLPKSGTTYLQTIMWNNRRRLRKIDWRYPGSRRMDHFHASEAVRGISRADDNHWQALVRELKDCRGTGLITHEFFSMATPDQATQAIADLRSELGKVDIQVVVTARDYVRQFPAVWQEALKMTTTLSLDEFMTELFADRLTGGWSWRSQRLPEVLATWGQAVGRDRVTIVTLPPSGSPRDLLWRRWCAAIGLDDTTLNTELAFSNESLGAPQAALLHRLKPALKAPLTKRPEAHRWVRQYFGHEVLVPQRGERFGLRLAQAKKLADLAAQDVATIRREKYRVVGDLTDLTPTLSNQEPPHPDDVGVEEMLEVAVAAMAQMIQDVRTLTKERDEARAQLPANPQSTLRGAALRLRDRVRGSA